MQLLIKHKNKLQVRDVKHEQCVNLGQGYKEALPAPTIITGTPKPHGTNSNLPSQSSQNSLSLKHHYIVCYDSTPFKHVRGEKTTTTRNKEEKCLT